MTAGRQTVSLSKEWCTPPKYIFPIMDFLGEIDLDPCSNLNSKIEAKVKYSLPEHDGLKESWCYDRIFVNPPYGRDKDRKTSIKDWVHRCNLANQCFKSEVLALIPVATNTKHWKYDIFGIARGVCFLQDTRLKFSINGKEEGKGAPMACAMVYWGEDYLRFHKIFSKFGFVVDTKVNWLMY